MGTPTEVKKISMKMLLLIIIVLISCSPPVNTWDPMVSENIMTSKKNGLFIAQYNIGKDSLCSLIKEAWVENGWHNESKLGWGK